MQDVWSEQENEDLDRAIALSLAEQDQKGKRVICKLFFLFEITVWKQYLLVGNNRCYWLLWGLCFQEALCLG